MSIFKGTTEPKKIYYGEPIIISDMQGPCPDGFHIPLSSEWQAIYDAGISLGAWTSSSGNGIVTNLKMPKAGNRVGTTGSTGQQDTVCRYWSSSLYESDTIKAYAFYVGPSVVNPTSTAYQTESGLSIRPMKNSPVAPDSNWTVIYQGTGTAGIYHNSTLGLISISSDGTTWITISDKNLGATTVYNDGDTLSEANCGKYYQWGNNYGFPRTGDITKSSTAIDASAYGPGNYYESSTFIYGNGYSRTWDTSGNDNLWGGVTQKTEEKGAVKAVYLGENKVRPSADTRTFTISRTEKSNMSSGWTYSDDAAGLTAGDTAFDEFFGYYGCRLNASGVETAKITQEESGGAGKLDITQLGTLTSGDNVMIAFPVMGIKMSKSGSTVTLSITKELNKSGYQYYAHSTGTLSNPGTPKDVFYLGAYKGYSSSSVIKSWSGQSPTVSQTQATFITRAKANGSGYNIIGFYQRMFVNCLYMMKYGNPDSQTVVGKGYTGGSAKVKTGGTNSQTNATYGTTSTTVQAKLFGLEDRWGNIREWIGGMCTDSSKNLWTALSGFTGAITTSSPYENTGTTIQRTNGSNLSSIVGSNKGLFAPTATVSNSSYNTYYCDSATVNTSCMAITGGHWSAGSSAGAFRLEVNWDASGTSGDLGSRLMYLNGLT